MVKRLILFTNSANYDVVGSYSGLYKNRTLYTESSSYLTSGSVALLNAQHVILCDNGNYLIIGSDTNSIKFPWYLFFEQTLTAGWSRITWQ